MDDRGDVLERRRDRRRIGDVPDVAREACGLARERDELVAARQPLADGRTDHALGARHEDAAHHKPPRPGCPYLADTGEVYDAARQPLTNPAISIECEPSLASTPAHLGSRGERNEAERSQETTMRHPGTPHPRRCGTDRSVSGAERGSRWLRAAFAACAGAFLRGGSVKAW